MNYRSSKISILFGIMRLPNVMTSPPLLLYDIRLRLCVGCAVFSRSVVPDTFVTPWIAAGRAPLSMEFSRQEYWSGLPCPPPGDLPNPGIEPRSLTMQGDSLRSEPLLKQINKETKNGSWSLRLSFGWRQSLQLPPLPSAPSLHLHLLYSLTSPMLILSLISFSLKLIPLSSPLDLAEPAPLKLSDWGFLDFCIPWTKAEFQAIVKNFPEVTKYPQICWGI